MPIGKFDICIDTHGDYYVGPNGCTFNLPKGRVQNGVATTVECFSELISRAIEFHDQGDRLNTNVSLAYIVVRYHVKSQVTNQLGDK